MPWILGTTPTCRYPTRASAHEAALRRAGGCGARRGDAGRDAAFAAAAAVEGDATFAVSILGGRVLALAQPALPPTTGAYYSDPIRPFLTLEHEFPYTTGAGFVTTLHNLGGNPAVFSAL